MCSTDAAEYYEKKCGIREDAHAAYDRLAASYELIVLEGAGSPAEINLMDKDFVNMSMAEYAGADTFLVADINPGGVFASIYGTLKLIPAEHRRLIKGVIINKFRGDKSLLEGALDRIGRLTGVPVIAVIPFIHDLRIEQEDSMNIDWMATASGVGDAERQCLDIVVIRLPRMSNFTDFMPFEVMDNVSLRYEDDPSRIGSPDLVILPGSKNTVGDMQFLFERGLAEKIHGLRKKGVPVFGLCGGYQMLGTKISDPHGVEGPRKEIEGLGLLPVNTVINREKELSQVRGTVENLFFAEKGIPFQGYEIHMGSSTEDNAAKSAARPLRISERCGNSVDERAGCVSGDGLVFGSYVHGIFDAKKLRDGLLFWLAERKGVELRDDETQDEELVFDRLADLIEANMDIDAIFGP